MGLLSPDSSKTLRILVFGDRTTGKSSLISLLTRQEVLDHPVRTVGCSIDVATFNPNNGNHNATNDGSYFVEYVEVGSYANHPRTRQLLYKDYHAVILVHSTANKKSTQRLWFWTAELFGGSSLSMVQSSNGILNNENNVQNSYHTQYGPTSPSNLINNNNNHNNNTVPILVIGTKIDISNVLPSQRCEIADEFNALSYNLSCLDINSINGLNHIINQFLENVIENIKIKSSLIYSTPNNNSNINVNTGINKLSNNMGINKNSLFNGVGNIFSSSNNSNNPYNSILQNQMFAVQGHSKKNSINGNNLNSTIINDSAISVSHNPSSVISSPLIIQSNRNDRNLTTASNSTSINNKYSNIQQRYPSSFNNGIIKGDNNNLNRRGISSPAGLSLNNSLSSIGPNDNEYNHHTQQQRPTSGGNSLLMMKDTSGGRKIPSFGSGLLFSGGNTSNNQFR